MSDHSHCIHNVHRYGLRHSLNDGISCTTNVTIVAKPVSHTDVSEEIRSPERFLFGVVSKSLQEVFKLRRKSRT